ncbi:MAG: hypothetical protein BA874_00915 [Desulfuromonadales bacterium C00003068]|jgi:anti-sigma regulatory factor (Ser/Thr protein kinase)|nr:MAG: hypothetical protein BA874_00915 [Desulfuromonadales bacterium C00003068]
MAENSQNATMRIAAELASLEPLQEFVREQAHALALPEEYHLKLELVMEELVVNVFSYAYPDHIGDIEVECYLRQDQPKFCVTIRDWGAAFNPLDQAPPDTQLSCEERQIGGLGIFLAKEMTDSLSYQYTGATNEVTFCFNLS